MRDYEAEMIKRRDDSNTMSSEEVLFQRTADAATTVTRGVHPMLKFLVNELFSEV
jgi:hypothetical protein